MDKAMFAAGCFWGVEEAFAKLEGVTHTAVGYAGGKTQNPTYKEVCAGDTNHAEVIEIQFDQAVISYSQLLKLFWSIHNPTTLNRQGVDIGSQYRSAIFYYCQEQKELAKNSKVELENSGKWENPIVTEITKASTFYKAEEYHQRYFEKNGGGACRL